MFSAAITNTCQAVRTGRRQPSGSAAPLLADNTRPGLTGKPPAYSPQQLLGDIQTSTGAGYQLLEVLGQGGMGVVYKARRANGQIVALKKMCPGYSQADERWLKQEAAVLSRLSHKNILSVYESGTTNQGEFYFTAEMLDGQNLDQLLQGRKLSIGQSLNICLQIAQAMDYAHKQGVFHRDLKPANIMITNDANRQESVKIIDFGISAVSQENASTTPADESGSVIYMSPEQAWRLPYSEKSDIYQLGLILFKCLTGRLPFMPTVAHAITYRLDGDILPDWFGCGLYGRDVVRLLTNMLARDPAERPTGMAEVAALLKTASSQLKVGPLALVKMFYRQKNIKRPAA